MKTLFGSLATLAAAAVILSGPGSASAQVEHRPSESRLTVGDWTFVPIEEVAGGTQHVHSILALRDKTTSNGVNIVSIWYEPPQAGATAWVAKCWDSQDQWEAIKNLKAGLGIGDSYDALWPTADQLSAAPPFEIPKDYVKGFKVTDPTGQAISQSADRDLLVEAFTEWGYQSADLAFEKDAYTCGADTFLDHLKAAWEDILTTKAATVEAGSAIMQAHLAAACSMPVSQTTTTSPSRIVPGTTITIPSNCDWLSTSPTWAPGDIKRDPDSDSTGMCCYKREFYILIVCRQGGFFWTHWLWHYDCIRKYTWQQPFCCNNRNLGECPTDPGCSPPATSPTPIPGVPVKGPDLYYDE
jgi:hypothetical protein